MTENSNIAWCDATFNPWMGCLKVSPGCENCYAEAFVTGRMKLPVWGPSSTTERRKVSRTTWKNPLAWNHKAQRAGTRTKVFCASLADVFEDNAQVAPWRAELFEMIEQTPHLDWQLLTKRPQNLRRMLPASWLENPRPNVWLGCTVEDQQRADERIPHLLGVPAAVRFLSCEPLLTLVNLHPWLCKYGDAHKPEQRWGPCCSPRGELHWIICGGESGPGFRPCDVAWIRLIAEQCTAAQVPVFVKQDSGPRPGMRGRISDDLLIRQFPELPAQGGA